MSQVSENPESSFFVSSTNSGGSINAVFRIKSEDRAKAILGGEIIDGGLAAFKGVDETRREFKVRACKELGIPGDHKIWGESEKSE